MKTSNNIEREIIALKRKIELIDKWIAVSKYSPSLAGKVIEKTEEKMKYIQQITDLQEEMPTFRQRSLLSIDTHWYYTTYFKVQFFVVCRSFDELCSLYTLGDVKTIDKLNIFKKEIDQYVKLINR